MILVMVLSLPNTPSGGISPYYYYLKDLDENVPLGVLSYHMILYIHFVILIMKYK